MGIIGTSIQDTYEQMQAKLAHVVPDIELRIKAELVFEINRLKKERGALILGHNYMEPALYHTVPDVVGDSLELSRQAALTKCDPIIFCGVRFMAETAKILNPNRTVLLPAKEAGCSLAASITAEDVRQLKKQHPGVPVVTYINTYADVKAESDICCTSGNAVKVVESLPGDTVIFLPDEYLAKNVANETKKKVIFWKGRCEVHEQFSVEDVKNVRSQFPGVVVLAHPECSPEVVAVSDFSSSTSKMSNFIKNSPSKRFLILTECSMSDNLSADNPDKEMVGLCSIRCPHMNQITLEDTLDALRYNRQIIEVPKEISDRARGALERMLAIS
jgi:quinolinate synthase